MFFDDERTLRTINNAPNPYIIKIFFYLAFHQPNDGIKGFKIDKQQLQYDLKLGRTVFFDSLRWLKDNICIHELKIGSESDFMVNPYIVMNNSDREDRIKAWSSRLDLEYAKEIKNRERKRRAELKKQNQ